MIVSSITFDEWGCRLRVHRPNGYAFLYDNGRMAGQFYRDSEHGMKYKPVKGRVYRPSRIITLLSIVSSMI